MVMIMFIVAAPVIMIYGFTHQKPAVRNRRNR